MLGRRGLSFGHLLLATGLGVAGGIYIYQPIFQEYSKNIKSQKEKGEKIRKNRKKDT
ncbi:protein PIGBOS1 [Podarcis raffonei]|uniref:protein PIGBOS1 n=1 Tax=Podarcis raffonei TaxID=65483 RepID=UPI0023293EE1|nr:protein PIGBOS1 [Podarcis raffonei]